MNIARGHGKTGLSQTALAKMGDAGINTISRWETGTYEPTLDDLENLSRALGVRNRCINREKRTMIEIGDSPVADSTLKVAIQAAQDVIDLSTFVVYSKAIY